MDRPCANRHSHIGESAESRIGGLLGDRADGMLEDLAFLGVPCAGRLDVDTPDRSGLRFLGYNRRRQRSSSTASQLPHRWPIRGRSWRRQWSSERQWHRRTRVGPSDADHRAADCRWGDAVSL